MAKKVLLLLVSRTCMKREVAQNQERARALLQARGIEFSEIDGSDPENKQR